MAEPKFIIRTDQRTVEIGKTNSGKSYLANYLVRPIKRLIVCDSKQDIDLDIWHLEEFTPAKFAKMLRDKTAPFRLRLRTKDDDEWSDWLKKFLKLRDTYIVLDELIQMGDAAKGPELRGLFTRGRSRGLGVMACTQRPARIPLESLSEAETYIIFQVKLERDHERIYEFVGEAGLRELRRWGYESFADLGERQYMVYSDLTGEAKLYDYVNVTER